MVLLIPVMVILTQMHQKVNLKPRHFDLVVTNATIVDGSGRQAFPGDVGITGSKITAIGNFAKATSTRRIDAAGLVLTPGFIDPHSHIDQTILENRNATPALVQGITTAITGMDGESPLDLAAYYRNLENGGIGINLGSLVGQAAIRRSLLGNWGGTPTPFQLNQMVSMVDQAMTAGALGLSTGLEYLPGKFTPTNEIILMARASAARGGYYSTHIRNERDGVLEAVNEALLIGREAGLPVNIAHIKINRAPWRNTTDTELNELTAQVIRKISSAVSSGQKVWADLYPYTVSYANTDERLADLPLGIYPPQFIRIMRTRSESYLGKTLTQIADYHQTTPGQAISIILGEDPDTRVFIDTNTEASLIELLKIDFTVIGVDAPREWLNIRKDHPRGYGTFPRVLSRYVRENRILSLEEAIAKMTGRTAKLLNLDRRGLIKDGYFADLVIFNPRTIKDMATYAEPKLPPVGIEYVIINGQLAFAKGKITGIRSGKVIKNKRYKPAPKGQRG